MRTGDPVLDLASRLSAALGPVIAQGFEFPIFWVVVAANGEMLAGRYDLSESGSGLESRLLVRHSADGTFAVPINLMFVDSRGEAARVVIKQLSVGSDS